MQSVLFPELGNLIVLFAVVKYYTINSSIHVKIIFSRICICGWSVEGIFVEGIYLTKRQTQSRVIQKH